MKTVKEVKNELTALSHGAHANRTVEDRPLQIQINGKNYDISKITTKTNNSVVLELEGI